MTNTLHRFGNAQSFKDDFIVFAIPTKVKKDPDAVPKLHRFLEMALEFKPVTWATRGTAARFGHQSIWARWRTGCATTSRTFRR